MVASKKTFWIITRFSLNNFFSHKVFESRFTFFDFKLFCLLNDYIDFFFKIFQGDDIGLTNFFPLSANQFIQPEKVSTVFSMKDGTFFLLQQQFLVSGLEHLFQDFVYLREFLELELVFVFFFLELELEFVFFFLELELVFAIILQDRLF